MWFCRVDVASPLLIDIQGWLDSASPVGKGRGEVRMGQKDEKGRWVVHAGSPPHESWVSHAQIIGISFLPSSLTHALNHPIKAKKLTSMKKNLSLHSVSGLSIEVFCFQFMWKTCARRNDVMINIYSPPPSNFSNERTAVCWSYVNAIKIDWWMT